jgi:hypothetical protein
MRATFDISNDPMAHVLTRLLEPHGLGWAVRREVLSITSRDLADEYLVTGFFYVPREMQATLRAAGAFRPGAPPELAAAAICKLVSTVISPSTWADKGGPGTVWYFRIPDTDRFGLVVSQTHDVYRRVREFLRDIPTGISAETLRECVESAREEIKSARRGSNVPQPAAWGFGGGGTGMP